MSPLNSTETAALAADLLGQDLAPAQSRQLFQDTEGNPLFVVETVRAGVGGKETGKQVDKDGGWNGQADGSLHSLPTLSTLPPKVRAVIQRRLSMLSPDAQALAQIAAVIGREFTFDVLIRASGQIAVHYEQAGRPQPAIAFYRRAAAAAQRIYANAEAIWLYNHLLSGELRKRLSPVETCELMLALGEVWRVNGQWAQAEAIHREAMAMAETLGDVALQARAQRALADVMRLQSHYDEGLEWLAKAEHGFEATGDWRGVVSALWTMAEIYWFKGDNKQALATLERQLRIAGEIGDPRGVCEALDTMGMVYWSQGDWDGSVDCCQRSIAIAEPLGYHLVITRAAITLGNVYFSQQRAAEAVQWYLRAGVLARQIDDRQVLSWAIENSANLLQGRGDYLRALAGHEQALRISLEIGDRWTAWQIIFDVGEAAERLQASEQAEFLYRKTAIFGKLLDSPSYYSGMLVELARLLLEQGRSTEARPFYDEAVAMIARVEAEQLDSEDMRFDAQVLGVRLRHALGELAPTDAATELRDLLDQRSVPSQRAALHHELWRLVPQDEQARSAAAKLYGSLYAETGFHDYRQRYQELTRETLPDPQPLPDVSELIPAAEMDLDGLIARLEPLLAQLDASFD